MSSNYKSNYRQQNLPSCLVGIAKKKTPKWVFCLERVKGIGPSQPAWKAGVLPLNYTRIFTML